MPEARRRVRRLAVLAGASAAAGDDIELMAAELLANAVRYGAGDKARVRVAAGGGVFRIEVRDEGTGPLLVADGESCGERGRGLLIVAALSSAWGLDRDECGTTAWCEASW